MSQRGHLVNPTGPRKTWAIMYRDGDENLRWEGKFNSRTDAQRRLTSVLAEIDKGTYTRPSSLTFEQFSKEWLAGRRQIRGSTESGYGSLIKSQLIPRLGSLTVSHIRFEHIDAAVSGMVEEANWPQRRFTMQSCYSGTCSLADRDQVRSGAVLHSQIIHWA